MIIYKNKYEISNVMENPNAPRNLDVSLRRSSSNIQVYVVRISLEIPSATDNLNSIDDSCWWKLRRDVLLEFYPLVRLGQLHMGVLIVSMCVKSHIPQLQTFRKGRIVDPQPDADRSFAFHTIPYREGYG